MESKVDLLQHRLRHLKVTMDPSLRAVKAIYWSGIYG